MRKPFISLKVSREFLLIIVFTLLFGAVGYFATPTHVEACSCPGYASFHNSTTCGGSNACPSGFVCTIACFDGDWTGDGVADGSCSGCTPGSTPPPPGSPPPPPGGWGGCGSCSGCMGDNPGQCRSTPDGGCVWDPGGCGSPACTPTFPGIPTQLTPADKANVVATIGGSVPFTWNLAGWGRGCPNTDNARLLYGLKTKAACDFSQITWSSGVLGAAYTANRPVTGADPYLKLNTTYCWQVSQNNGTYTNYSAIREFTVIPSAIIDSAAFATPTKCGGQRISGSAIYPDTNNPVTYSIDITHPLNDFAAGVNYLKEVDLGMVPNTVLNSVTATSAITEPKLRSYLGFKVTGLGTYPNNIQFASANNAAVPVWANSQSSGDLTNAAGTATLLGLGTQTTVTQVDNDTLRITFTIRFEDSFPVVPVLNSYVMAVMSYDGSDYSQDVVGANRFYYRKFETWKTDLQSPSVSVTGPTTIATTNPVTYRINWAASDAATGNNGISIFNGTCETSSGTGGPAGNPWSTSSTGGTGRRYFVSVEYNNKIYNWGGCNTTTASCTNPLESMDIYDIATGTWSSGAPNAIGRYGAIGEAYNGKIYIWGGYTGAAYTNRMDIYDIATNTWTTGLAGAASRYLANSGVYNGRIYIFGGYNGTAYVSTLSIYNIATNTWSTGSAIPITAATGAALYNNKFYIWGGYNGSALTNVVNIYDPVANTWSTGTSGGTPRWMLTPVINNGKLYAYGGCTNTSCSVVSKFVDIYDIASGTWTVGVTPSTVGRAAYKAIMKNGKIYAVNGSSTWASAPLSDIGIYDIATGEAVVNSGSVVQITQTTSPVTGIELVSGVETRCLFVTDYTNEALIGSYKLYRQDSTQTWDGITLRMYATDGACNSPVATTATNNAEPWTMVRNGSASAKGGFSGFSIPDIDMSTLYPGSWGDEAFLSAHTSLSGNNSMLSSRQAVHDTYATFYNDLNTDPATIMGFTTWYDTINKIISDRFPTGVTNLTTATVPANLDAYPAGQTVFLRYTPSGGTLSTGTSFNCTRPAVILVNGNMNIYPNMNYSADANKCVWVVKGNVTVSAGADLNPISGGVGTNSDTMRGNIIITDGTFTVSPDPQNATTYGDSLWAWPVIAKQVSLQRDLGGVWNSRYPSEFFQFDPSLIYFLSDELAVTKFSIRPK